MSDPPSSTEPDPPCPPLSSLSARLSISSSAIQPTLPSLRSTLSQPLSRATITTSSPSFAVPTMAESVPLPARMLTTFPSTQPALTSILRPSTIFAASGRPGGWKSSTQPRMWHHCPSVPSTTTGANFAAWNFTPLSSPGPYRTHVLSSATQALNGSKAPLSSSSVSGEGNLSGARPLPGSEATGRFAP